MSARLVRSTRPSFCASARTHININVRLPMRRNMSAQSHPVPKSDTPWIVGAALVFGPAFLYLLSPSARKSQAEHAIHNDYHDFPALRKETSSHFQASETEQEETKPTEIMTDDEGTPADVAASIALSEENDVPKDSQSPETVAETTVAAEQASIGSAAVEQDAPVVNEEPAKEEADGPVESAEPPASPSTEKED